MLTFLVDAGFGANGYTDATYDRDSIDVPVAVAVQDDGKVVVAGNTLLDNGDIGLVRFDANGSLDANFANGIQSTDIYRNSYDNAVDMVIQPDGKIVVAGNTLLTSRPSFDFAVVRYNPDGSLDTTFDDDGGFASNDGIQTTDLFFDSEDFVTAVALQPDGKIVVVGYTTIDPDTDIAVVRYNSDGTLDTTFDDDGQAYAQDGIQTTDVFDGSDDFAAAVAIQEDGKIVVAGTADLFGSSDYSLALLRYNPNGTLDTTFDVRGFFDNDGIVTDYFGPGLSVKDVVIQDDGKILVFGEVSVDSRDHLLVARYLPDGDRDSEFGDNGSMTLDLWGSSDVSAGGIALQSDGKIILTATVSDYPAILRLHPDGTADWTAAENDRTLPGIILSDEFDLTDSVRAANGDLLLTAPTNFAAGADFGVVRITEQSQYTTSDVTYRTSRQGDLRVYGGRASDEIVVAVREGNVTINGVDTGLANGSIRNLFVFGRAGDDIIQISNVDLQGNLRVIGSAGNDLVTFTGCSVASSTRVVTGGGDDTVLLGLDFRTRAENTFQGPTVLTLGGGDDELYSYETRFLNRALLIGGGSRSDSIVSDILDEALLRGFEEFGEI